MDVRRTAFSILRTAPGARLRFALLLMTIVFTIAAAGASLTLAAQPPTIPTVPGARSSVGYNVKAEFDVGYKVKWSKTSGNPAQNCSGWEVKSGTNEVNAGTVKPVSGHVQLVTGTNEFAPSWGYFVAVGKATGSVERTLVQTGGYKWSEGCGAPKPPAYQSPANDCPGERKFTDRFASIHGEVVKGLAGARTLDKSPTGVKFGAIVFRIVPSAGSPYRNCEFTGSAPEFPVNVPLFVKQAERTALKKLKPGGSYTLEDKYGGYCTADDLPFGETCRFTLDLRVRLRRCPKYVAQEKSIQLTTTQQASFVLCAFYDSPGWTRTNNPSVNSRMLCQ
jgi:hypothetical protein